MPPEIAIASLTVVAASAVYAVWRSTRRVRRAEFIRTYELPRGLYDKLRERRPQLSAKDCSLVARGLRKFFLAHLSSGCRFVSMPSQVVDDLWHEFILYTREYQAFCRKAFGGFLHHSPAVVIGSQARADEGLRRVWWHACKEENINPRKPVRLPLLFALDAKLNIENGFKYVPNCEPLKRSGGPGSAAIYCGSDLAPSESTQRNRGRDGSGCGGASGCGGGSGSHGGDGGCGGGGCGGD